MKDLHIQIPIPEDFYLEQLCKYVNCNQTDLIKCLIRMAFLSAKTQRDISITDNKDPDYYPDLTPYEEYRIKMITEIFDIIHPSYIEDNLMD